MIPWLRRPRDPRHLLGLRGEAAAVRHVRKAGFRILKRNYCAADAEIDIIAERRGAVHFIEVKTRVVETHGTPEEAVTTQKVTRLRRAAHVYLNQFRSAPVSTSFDVIAVVLEADHRLKDIRWTQSAF